MTLEHKIICIPENDPIMRFLLGQNGAKELLAIGLNPSTANELKLDPTSRNIKTIANNNNCDGWWLINLYPLRTSKPCNLPKKSNSSLAKENISFIKKMISDESYKITTVLCCWGNTIDHQGYLKEYAKEILLNLEKLNIPYQCIGLTGKGNPFHPAPMGVNRFLGGIKNVRLRPYQAED